MKLQFRDVSVSRANHKGEMESCLALPEGTGPFPGLVVIHEIFGLNDNIREITQRFAAEGYAALGVDLFSNRNRTLCMLQIFSGLLLRPLNNAMLADLQSSLAFLGEQPGVDPKRLGAVGFCMGGSYALQLAVTEKELKAASVFYGMNPRPLDAVAQSCPLVGSYPGQDFTASAARELEAALARYEVPHDIKIYADAHHSFFNDTRPAFAPEAAQDAWERMLTFFDEHLKAGN